MTAAPPDLAHIAHAELLTPFPDESLRFVTDQFGIAWGVKTIETFHTYGTPDMTGIVGPPIPPTSAIPGDAVTPA